MKGVGSSTSVGSRSGPAVVDAAPVIPLVILPLELPGRLGAKLQSSESESDLFTGTIHGNTDCYLQFCAPRLPQGAVSGRVFAAARDRPACAGLSLGRLAPGTLTCLLVATSLLSIYMRPLQLEPNWGKV
jgi:hypothetical protein